MDTWVHRQLTLIHSATKVRLSGGLRRRCHGSIVRLRTRISSLMAWLCAWALLGNIGVPVQAWSLNAQAEQATAQQESPSRKARPRRTRPDADASERAPTGASAARSASSPQPFIRVALAVDVPVATISCEQSLGRIEQEGEPPIPLGETQVRVQPGMLQEPTPLYAVQVMTIRRRDQVSGLLQRLRQEFQQQEVMVKHDTASERHHIYVGRLADEAEANRLALRVKSAGYSEAKPVAAPPRPGLVLSSPSNGSLLRTASGLTLVSLAPAEAPLRFNGRAYRGRLVVLCNAQERLTIVNELPLEEYLWSVVPNELGPTAFGEPEALRAQAIAARTFAVQQKLKATAEDEYDILSDARAQVYTGVDAEHPLSTQAVNDTRGLILTYQGEPIEALYSSTCGGWTEDAEAAFGEAKPYLRGVACAPERSQLAARAITSLQKPAPEWSVALLHLIGLPMPSAWTAESLQVPATVEDVFNWMKRLATMLGRDAQIEAVDKSSLSQLEGLARALVSVFYPPDYATVMVPPADVDYILDGSDTQNWPSETRAAIATLIRDGVLSLPQDASLNRSSAVSRQHVLTALFRLAERAGLIRLQSGLARRLDKNGLLIRLENGATQTFSLSDKLFLFKQSGDVRQPIKRIAIAGGERVWFRQDTNGRIDYLAVEPHANGVSLDRYSPAAVWEVRLTPRELADRLRARGIDVGDLVDVIIEARSATQRVTLVRVIGAGGARELRGSAIRAVLGVRGNRFVIDRRRDAQGNVVELVFAGRGWGHGVGLCQVGAYGLALEGASYAEILRRYYTGVAITRIY
ncbi:MAG: SpoIID/LytB domain-containing protein [Acidobacteriota bacterium]|nr:SpoIID/LytB domain-containing protein [Acidobacteriota bacterium]